MNIKSYFNRLCLVIIIFSLGTVNSNAVPVSGITKMFKGFGKIFKKGADEIPEAGSKIDDIKNINKSDDFTINTETENMFNDLERLSTNKNLSSEIKNTNYDEILNIHGVKFGKKVSDLVDKTGVDVNDLDPSNFFEDDSAINTFRIFWWFGRVFRYSTNYNKPNDDRMVINCKTNKNEFLFTALLDKKKKWLLLSGNKKNLQKGIYSPNIKRQELYVLVDNDQYIIFSTKSVKDKIYPLNYFIISSDGKFVHEINLYGTNSPEYLMANADKKIGQSKSYCKKV